MASLFMTVEDALTPSLRGLIAEALGETPEAVNRGVRCLSGGVVSGLIATASTPPGATGVLRAVRRMDVGLLFDASPLLDSGWQASADHGLLGNRAAALASAAAGAAEIRPESARALINILEPLVLAAIARSGVASDEAGLRSFLRSVEPEATRLAPPAAPTQQTATGGGASRPSPPGNDSAPPATLLDAPSTPRAGDRRLLWIVLALALIALLLLFTVGRD